MHCKEHKRDGEHYRILIEPYSKAAAAKRLRVEVDAEGRVRGVPVVWSGAVPQAGNYAIESVGGDGGVGKPVRLAGGAGEFANPAQEEVIGLDKEGNVPKVKLAAPWLQYLNYALCGAPSDAQTRYACLCTPHIFGRYAGIFGLTGSVGGKAEATYLAKTYQALKFDVPRFLDTCAGDVRKVISNRECSRRRMSRRRWRAWCSWQRRSSVACPSS